MEIQNYYQSGPKFKGVSSRNNLPNTMKDGASVINNDEYKSIWTHWIAWNANSNSVTYSDNFGIEHILEKIKRFICNKNIITIIFRIQAYDLIIYGNICRGFMDFMFKGKTLTHYTNLWSPPISKRMINWY